METRNLNKTVLAHWDSASNEDGFGCDVLFIDLPPGVTAEVSENGTGYDLQTWGPPSPDSRHPETTFPGGTTLTFPNRKRGNSRQIAQDIITTITVEAMHDAMEFVKIDNKVLAEAHPDQEAQMWDWMARRVGEVVAEYLDRYPAADVL